MKTNSFAENAAQIIERDLNKVINEVLYFHNEEELWLIRGVIKNSSGNLALHIAGAVNHFIGAVLGKNGYVRTRDKEFSEKNVHRDEIFSELNKAKNTVKIILPGLSEGDLQKEFPERLGSNVMTVECFIMHLISHVNYHLGQINYHRRLLEENEKPH